MGHVLFGGWGLLIVVNKVESSKLFENIYLLVKISYTSTLFDRYSRYIKF